MKKIFVLLAILLLPSLAYLFFSLGTVKYSRVPFYGPRKPSGTLDARGKPDTTYYQVPVYQGIDEKRQAFSAKAMDHRIYVASFIRRDSLRFLLSEFANDWQMKPSEWRGLRFVFFVAAQPGDSAKLPDIGKDLNMPDSTVVTLAYPQTKLDSIRETFFPLDPAHPAAQWSNKQLFVIVDRTAHLRGYYDPRQVADIRFMREDYKHILLHDEAVETIEGQKIEQHRQ